MSARTDYPAIAVLHDAWVESGRKCPEAVRALIELDQLRAENESLRAAIATYLGSPASTKQVQYIARLCAEKGMDREAKLEFCRITVARGIASTKDLTSAEASSVIDALRGEK